MNGNHENGDVGLSARAVFHAEVKRQRELSGWSLTELSERARYDASYLQRLEKGDRLGTVEAARILDGVYGTGEHITNLWRLAKKEAGHSRYQGFMDLSSKATSMQQFSVSTVPGLLQTMRYAEAQFRTSGLADEDLLAEQLALRMGRQERLSGAKALNYRVLLDESAIRRATSDPEVWAEQLEKLVEAAGQPNISLHIVPFAVGLHGLLGGSLTLMWLPSGRTVAYVESSRGGLIFDEIEEVEQFRLSYDQLRDAALSRPESVELLRTLLEDHRHAHSGIAPEPSPLA